MMKKLALCLAVMASPALANDWDIALKVNHGIPGDHDRLEPSTGLQVDVCRDWLCLWASRSKPDNQLLGQDMGDIELYGAGLGVRRDLPANLTLSGFFGYYHADVNNDAHIQDEAVFQRIRNDFPGIPFRHITATDYRVRSNYGGSLQLGFRPDWRLWRGTRLEIAIGHRFLSLKEELDAWKGEDPRPSQDFDCGCWVQQRSILDASQTELTFALWW